MSAIKAIETRYAGCRFRSRLEARWAVFFDAMEIEWQYEPQGFELPSGRYLPDFFLPKSCFGTWIEVKGAAPTRREIQCAVELTRILASEDQPWTYRMLVGDVPRTPFLAAPSSTIRAVGFAPPLPTVPSIPNLKAFPDYVLMWPSIVDGKTVGAKANEQGVPIFDGPSSALTPIEHWGLQRNLWGFLPELAPRVASSLTHARSARFEHGESPARPVAIPLKPSIAGGESNAARLATMAAVERGLQWGMANGRAWRSPDDTSPLPYAETPRYRAQRAELLAEMERTGESWQVCLDRLQGQDIERARERGEI